MKTLRYAALALAVSGVFTLGARAGDNTNAWWNVDFEALEGKDLVNQREGPNGAMVVLTNTTIIRDNQEISHRTWEAGEWTTVEGDETIVTNSYFPTNSFGGDYCLKLDTQGNDLTWKPAETNAVSLMEKVKTLVDADLYLVGSDSAPEKGDFDEQEDVQTAIYLKNETEEDSGETTNSVLCVYVRDASGHNYWQELEGAGIKMEDNAWAHVQVLVDHSPSTPKVYVYVNNTQMMARGGDPANPDDWRWTVANLANAQEAKKVSSVSFRGTGAIDNFVGVAIETTYDSFDFTAQVLMDGTNVLTTGTEGNVTRMVHVEAGAEKFATFPAFVFHDQHWDDNAWNPEDEDYTGGFVVSYALTKIEIVDFANDTTQTFNYGYDKTKGVIVPVTESPYIVFDTETAEDEETGEEYEYYSGPFSIAAPTLGATADSTIVRIYFETLPADGDFRLTASQNVGTAPADQKFNTNTLSVASTTFTFDQAITDGGKSYILSTLTVGATPAGITAAAANRKVVVTVPLDDQIAEGVYNVASATYVEGTLADGEELQGARDGNVYTYTKYTPPVAIIVAGGETTEYESLRAAILAATAGDTITLLRDDAVSFSAEAPEIEIDKNLTIDGGSNTLYGVTDFSGGYHDIFISAGNVTIKDLKITEFGDTAPFNRDTYPIWTPAAYNGELVLDGVTIDKFVRTAVNLGGGTVLITNCTFAADPTAYFQSGVETLDADVTVVDTTITGVNSTIEGEDPDAAAVFTLNGYDGTTGSGTITVLSGDYSGQFIVAVNPDATGSAILSNGTFVATAPAEDEGQPLGAFLVEGLATVEVAGGWYDREPAGYVADGLTAVQDADNAPDPAATWTVKAAAVQIEGDATKSYLSIAEAQAAAATAGIDDPVFVIVAPLSAETVTLAAADDTLTVKTDDTGYLANLEVVTSLAGSDAVEYAVEPRTVGLEPPITVTYMVVPTYYVAKIVDGGTTTKYETFTAAATAAMAETPTLVVEMVANTNALEDAFAITGSLKVKAGGFLIPELVPEDRSHYLDASEPDENGVVTYTSKAYLTATFLNGDGSTLQEVAVRVGETPIPTFDFGDVEPYPPAQPGYVVHFAMTWTPAIGPISEDTVFRPNFTTNVMDYSIQYVLDGGDWPAGYTPPEWYAVTNATIELPSPAKDGWTFNGWYTNKTEGVYVGDLVNPGTIPTGSYGPKFFYASWTEDVVEPPKVEAGDGLAEYAAAHPSDPIPAPLAINPATQKAEISFVAPADGRYTLFTCSTPNGEFVEDATTAQTVDEGELVTLIEGGEPPEAGAKFFRIGWEDAD